jgi:hypothetical protein
VNIIDVTVLWVTLLVILGNVAVILIKEGIKFTILAEDTEKIVIAPI